MANRAIFRESAVQAYQRGTVKDIMPRLTAWPSIACLWLLLVLLVATLAVTWSVRVTSLTTAQGVVLRNGTRAALNDGRAAAALFLPPEQAARLHAGQPVHARMGSAGPAVTGVVVRVEPGAIGPHAARARYRFGPGTGQQAWVVAIVRLPGLARPAAYGGRPLTARVETGSRRLLAFFPGLGGLFGGAS